MIKHPYCKYVLEIKDKNDVDKVYHDKHYGRDIKDDNELFCRLVMEINQAGLSWRTILKKEKNFRKAFHNFDIKKIASYKEKDFNRLMKDISIIRNKLKINSAIHNARQIMRLQKEYKSFRKWLDINAQKINNNSTLRLRSLRHKRNAWLVLFKKHFKFVGGEIVGEFLMSIGILDGSHDKNCKAYARIGKS